MQVFMKALGNGAGFQDYSAVPAEIVANVILLPDYPLSSYLADTRKVSFYQAASIPAAICTAAVGFYNPLGKSGLALTPPWEPTGKDKYKDQGILIFDGASTVGQCGASSDHNLGLRQQS
jgi:NADPH:quinone reductase-like Zn-dependent oxidoreductase